MTRFSRRPSLILCPSIVLLLALPTAGAPSPLAADEPGTDPSRFEPSGTLLGHAAEWIGIDEERMAFGSGTSLTLGRVWPAMVEELRVALDAPITQGVLTERRLYLNESNRRLLVLDLDTPLAPPRAAELTPAPAGPIRLGRMGDHLLVAESGSGVRILLLPFRHTVRDPAHHDAGDRLVPVGRLPFEVEVTAVAGSGDRVYLATGEGRLVEVDATDPAAPRILRTHELPGSVQALAANGRRVYLLHEEGMRILELSGDTARASPLYPVAGRDLQLAGRTLRVAGGEAGLQSFYDRAASAQTVQVSVTSSAFVPRDVTVEVGDTVEWTNISGRHNVENCDGLLSPPQCGGVVASESFSSGAPAFPPWTYSHTFVREGANPYFCQVHVSGGMVGSVTVVPAAAAPPPGVPDGGSGSTPMTVAKIDDAGNELTVSFDATTCSDQANHALVWGGGAQLPTTPGGIYGVGGALCDLGTGSPATWAGAPIVAPGDFVWWVVVAADGAGTEGSWGRDSAGLERSGPGTNGASAACGNLAKDLTNLCGQ